MPGRRRARRPRCRGAGDRPAHDDALDALSAPGRRGRRLDRRLARAEGVRPRAPRSRRDRRTRSSRCGRCIGQLPLPRLPARPRAGVRVPRAVAAGRARRYRLALHARAGRAKATRRTAADADAAASRQGARFASVSSRISSSQSTSARQTRPTPDGSTPARPPRPCPSSGRYVGLAASAGSGPPSVHAERAGAAREHDARDARRPPRSPTLAACVRQQYDRVLEIADDGERQRGQPHRDPVEQPQQRAAPARRTRRSALAIGVVSSPRAPRAPLVGQQRRGAVEHRARRARQHDEPEQRREHLPVGVDEAALDRQPRDLVRSTVRRSRRRATRRARGARRRGRPPRAPPRSPSSAWLKRRKPISR